MSQDTRVIRMMALKNQALIADKCHVAESFMDRLRGLIGRARMEAGEGMLFPRCNNIHMWFMRIPIDVVFLKPAKLADGSMRWRVVSAHENVRPWRALPLMDLSASDTLELPIGTIQRHGIAIGDELCTS